MEHKQRLLHLVLSELISEVGPEGFLDVLDFVLGFDGRHWVDHKILEGEGR